MKNQCPLIVIDMQPYFLRDMKRGERRVLVGNTAELIARAKSKEVPVFLVEYGNVYGDRRDRTTLKLRNSLKDYKNSFCVEKYRDGGSKELIPELRRLGFAEGTTLIVCGINLDFCVAETVDGLVRDGGYKCSIVREATLNVKYPNLPVTSFFDRVSWGPNFNVSLTSFEDTYLD